MSKEDRQSSETPGHLSTPDFKLEGFENAPLIFSDFGLVQRHGDDMIVLTFFQSRDDSIAALGVTEVRKLHCVSRLVMTQVQFGSLLELCKWALPESKEPSEHRPAAEDEE